jgi:hypothetical protein
MARQRISEYVFTPGVSGSGTIKVPGRVNLEDFLAIYNTTDQISIYNFGDTAQGGTVAWTAGVTAEFPTAYAGVTTLNLDADTSAMNANDKLAIYVETGALVVEPWSFGMDAIGRERVSNPQALIDADFEYGLQNTKWQNVSTINNIPAFYEDVGADIAINTNGYVTMIAGDDQITSNVDTSVRLQNQSSAQWVAADYGLVISQTQGNVTPFTSNYLTTDINSSAERTFTMASTTGFDAGDNIIIIGNPGTGGTTVAVANITSVGTTTVNCANVAAAGIGDGSYIIVETDTANVFEVMSVTNVTGNALTVVRQSNRSNGTSANITIGNDVFAVNNIEIAKVFEVTDGTTLQLTRGWYNIPAANSFKLGSVIQKLSGNVELVNMSAINTAVNGVQTFVRGQFGTTALAAAGVGSPVIRMTGIFNATGDSNVPQIAVNADAHGLTAGDYVSSQNQANTNATGVSYVYFANDNNFAYYPPRTTGLAVGYPLNRIDSVIREAFQYTGADLDVVSIVSNESTPSTITITTQYAHGLVPGTPIIVALTSGVNQAYATGSFFVTEVPSTTTFSYTAKAGAAVSGSLAGIVNVRSNAAFLPRPFDGGVIMGPGTPTRGASAVRQTKKYFRYQSGKGILFTSGTMLKPTFDIASIVAAGTSAGSNITVTTDIEHGLNAGAVVDLSGITTTGYNDTGYTVTSIGSDTAFVIEAQNTLGSVAPELGQQPRVNITGWHGSSIRAGMMDDQNGLFWEHNGQTLNVVQRSSTLQLAGSVSVGVGSNLVTGDGACRFQDQLNNGDTVVIQGMTHTVASVLDNNRMTIVPTFRGVQNQTRVKMALRDEIRVIQDDFNVDRLDGTGYSGYTIDSSKMQMLGVEYSWYGAGYVQWMVRGQDGKFVMAHRLPNNNRNNEAYMRSGNLPGRYEAINETPTVGLDGAIDSSQTTISLRDASQYPAASVTYPVFVMIDSEVIKYSGKSGNDLTGCTRAATFTQWVEGASRSFTSSSAVSHADNTGVILISNTCTPLVNHWGSSVIMDGSFDDDEGYQFTFSRTSYGMPAIVGEKQTVFAMRLSPSVSNGIIGDLGERELINRAQLALSNMTVNITAGRFLVEGILNPSNIDSANTVWSGLNNAGGGFQPSFTQFATAPRYTGETTGGVTGSLFGTEGGFTKSGTKVTFGGSRNRTFAGLSLTNVSSSGANANITVQLTPTSTLYNNNTVAISVQNPGTGYQIGDTVKVLGNALGGATPLNDLNMTIKAITTELTGGERLFAIPISTTNSGVLDLSSVKQIGTSAVPGTGTYPNGPEVLAIQVTALSTSTTPVADVQLQFQESQA